MLVWSRIGHLLQIFIKTDAGSETTKESSGSTLRMQIIGGIVFVVCWLGLFGGLAYYVLFERNGSIGWFWFLVGIAITPCIILPPALSFLRRRSKRKTKYAADEGSNQRIEETYDYEITFDEIYIRVLIDRYLRQLPGSVRPQLLAILFTIAAAIIWIFEVFNSESVFVAAIVFVVGVLGSFFAYRVLRKIMFSDFGYASHMGKTSVYTLTTDGLEVIGHRPNHRVLWPDLIKWPDMWTATRFTDGIFLFGGGAIAWLPDSALTDARPNDVAQFIGKRMPLREAK